MKLAAGKLSEIRPAKKMAEAHLRRRSPPKRFPTLPSHCGAIWKNDFMLNAIAAIVFAALSVFVGVFQLALVFGAPWGELTMGGRYKGVLPKRMRIAPAIAAVLIFGFAVVVLARAELAFVDLQSLSAKLIWGVAAYCLLGVVLNFLTQSKRERALWFPIVSAMLICTLLVALR